MKGPCLRRLLSGSLLLLWLHSTVALAAPPDMTTDEQKTLYTLGLLMSRSLGNFSLSATELELVVSGLHDGVLQKPQKVDPQQFLPQVQELQRTRVAAVAEVEAKAGEAFLSKAAAESGARKTESGLVIATLTPGTGAAPTAEDTVKVHYHGTLLDGSVFDSSVQRGEPATFPLKNVIKCWTEGVQLMQVGGKSRLVCPPQLAYGDRGAPPRIKPGSTLVFEVELLEIMPPGTK